MTACRASVVVVLAWLALGPVAAAPPAGVDPRGPVAAWVQGWANALRELCCGLDSDCRPTAVRRSEDSPSGYEAWIDKFTYGATAPDRWMPVPRKAFSPSGENNPTGVSWACWYGQEVRCASLASGS